MVINKCFISANPSLSVTGVEKKKKEKMSIWRLMLRKEAWVKTRKHFNNSTTTALSLQPVTTSNVDDSCDLKCGWPLWPHVWMTPVTSLPPIESKCNSASSTNQSALTQDAPCSHHLPLSPDRGQCPVRPERLPVLGGILQVLPWLPATQELQEHPGRGLCLQPRQMCLLRQSFLHWVRVWCLHWLWLQHRPQAVRLSQRVLQERDLGVPPVLRL